MVSTSTTANTPRMSERSSRSRTPSRIATPQVRPTKVEKSKTKQKRSRSQTRSPAVWTASTPKNKPNKSSKKKDSSSKKKSSVSKTKSSSSSSQSSSKKRKILPLDFDDENEESFRSSTKKKVKKLKSPKKKSSSSTSTSTSTSTLSATETWQHLNELDEDLELARLASKEEVRRSKRIRHQVLNSIQEENQTGTSYRSSLQAGSNTVNGSFDSSDVNTNNNTGQYKWSWLSCTIM